MAVGVKRYVCVYVVIHMCKFIHTCVSIHVCMCPVKQDETHH